MHVREIVEKHQDKAKWGSKRVQKEKNVEIWKRDIQIDRQTKRKRDHICAWMRERLLRETKFCSSRAKMDWSENFFLPQRRKEKKIWKWIFNKKNLKYDFLLSKTFWWIALEKKNPAYLSIDYESSLILLTYWKLTKIDKYGQSATILSAWVEIATKFVERSPRASEISCSKLDLGKVLSTNCIFNYKRQTIK